MEDGTRIFMRQIAGAVARRIVCYSKEGDIVTIFTNSNYLLAYKKETA
jgi:phosphatidylserine decarboxylase